MLIDRAPEPKLGSGAFHHDFVQIPNITRAYLLSSQIASDLRSKLCDPTADSFIGNVYPAFEQHFLNFTQAQIEPQVKPNGVSNDLWRKTMTLEINIWCLHHRDLCPTRNAGNRKPINVTTPMPAFLISVVGFVESVSVGQTLAAKRRQRIDPDQELIGLGAANIAAGLSSGYPVTGGFARSVVNFDAGAQTPAAGVFTAVGIALAALFLTPLLASLPQATLAATIIVAVLSLVDFGTVRRVFAYSKSDFAAMAATIIVTLGWGVELGIVAGVLLSLLLHLYRTSKPHVAIVGQVPGTEHYRNIERHSVLTRPEVLSIRVDESLYFANSRFLEDTIAAEVAERPAVEQVVLMCSAVNAIDASALESLEEINRRLFDAGIGFHLSEVKGPVMDRLKGTDFLKHLNGQIFLSQHEAVASLKRDCQEFCA